MKNSYQKNKYVTDGSAARKLNSQPAQSYEESMDDWLERRELQRRQKRNREQRRKRLKREEETRMQLGTFLFLTALVGLTFGVCISYLKVRGDVTSISKEIASLQSEIITLKDENQIALEQVDSDVDLSYVYRIATKELGMVHPKQKQIITYKKMESDFVKQYADIPEAKKDNLLKKIIKKLKKH